MMSSHWLVPHRHRRNALPAHRGVHEMWFGDLFDELFRGIDLVPRTALRAAGDFTPRMDVTETEDELRVTVELPGVSEKDVEVSLEEDLLIVKGEKKTSRDEEGEGVRHVETCGGSFQRTLRLPCEIDIDAVKARHTDGVLTVILPKAAEAKPEVRTIPVKSS